ncbi:MAG: polyphosphate kinase 2 family protein [Vicinamibacterales bacterium]
MSVDIDRYRIKPGTRVRLKDHSPGDTGPFESRKKAAGELEHGLERLYDLQEKLFAQDRWAVLLILQAMDAAGKDSAIKHVMRGLNPQGTQVSAFKVPSAEELDHDFMWRTLKRLPERGRIGVFNRSYYEEVLVVRVHPEILARQPLPVGLVTPDIWKQRFEDIVAIERYLARNGTVIRKFFLNVSKKEQKKRFLERLDNPAKNWKFSLGDLEERKAWDDYMEAYEEAITATSSNEAPWYVVPADSKWYTQLVIAQVLVDALEGLGLEFPGVTSAQRKELAHARELLASDRED